MQKKKYKIFIVDDEPDVVRIFKRSLAVGKFDFISASDGLTAADMAIRELPDIIILDWNLPLMSGIDVLRNIKNNPVTLNIPVIIATGIMTDSTNLRTALEAGASDFIRKPADPVELSARVNSVLALDEEHKKTIRLEKEIFKQREEALVKKVEDEKRELMEESIQLALNNQLTSDMTLKIMKILKKSNFAYKSEIDKIIIEFRKENFEKNWYQFEERFNKLHFDFVKALKEKFPDLTTNEVKLCILYSQPLKTQIFF